MATSVLLPVGSEAFVLPISGTPADIWLPELDWRVSRIWLTRRTAVATQITEVQRITSLTDSQLAAAFPGGVSRETVVRWRTDVSSNLRPQNAYRLGLLYQLAKRMHDASIEPSLWLHQPVEGRDQTPYQLICEGGLAEVRQAVEAVASGYRSPAVPMVGAAIDRGVDAAVAREEGAGEWTWEPDDGEDV
jgi:hypothetical protein